MYTLEQLQEVKNFDTFLKEEVAKEGLNKKIQKEKSELMEFISEIEYIYNNIDKKLLEDFTKIKGKKEKTLKIIELIFSKFEKQKEEIEKTKKR